MQSFLAYKAEAAGVAVAYVDPAYTSRTCAQCGNLAHGDREASRGRSLLPRADLLQRLNRFSETRCEFERAASLTAPNDEIAPQEIARRPEQCTRVRASSPASTASVAGATAIVERHRVDPAGVVLVVSSACGFATLGIFGTFLERQGLDLSSVLAWRFAVAALLFWIWLLARGSWRIPARYALAAFVMGAIGYALQSAGYFMTFARVGVGLTSLLLYSYPAFVTLLAWPVDRERPSRRRLWALVIAFAGTSLAADPRGGHADLLGVAIGVGTAAWYAVYLTIGTRLVRAVDSLTASGYVCLGAMCSFLLAALAHGGLRIPTTSSALLLIAGIAAIATVVPIVALFAGMRRLGTPRAALLSTLEPAVTVALGAAMLHERFGPLELLGGALIITALVLLQLPQRSSPAVPMTRR